MPGLIVNEIDRDYVRLSPSRAGQPAKSRLRDLLAAFLLGHFNYQHRTVFVRVLQRPSV